MTIIADSGSTKTTWAVVETGNKVVTEGLNPHFSSDEQIDAACETVRKQLQINNCGARIWFYGAGCGSQKQRERMALLLGKAFESKEITVETDMLAACRATGGKEAAIVGILGTGSNACYYDGAEIAITMPSFGYLLGDRGSANNVGRRLLTRYLNREMSSRVSAMFQSDYPLSNEEWTDAVYHKPNVNRFLAQLATFAVRHAEEEECQREIVRSIREWYTTQVAPLAKQSECKELHIVGGFAKAIEETIRAEFSNYGLNIKSIIADPIDGLLQYHSL